ncbi:MAG: aromatic ring-hydroxylating dioxygenase subunit alpha, partial [Actinobacteria bacterium]|nr:aromatic ring-hydroxylating dioxygenase subunit alpha [Actinomycetota bacterium]
MQELLDEERVPVPEAFRAKSYEYLGSEDIPTERYTSRQFHDLEVERMWARVWQVACREEEIPAPGDIAVYDLAHHSILVVRQTSGEIKAFHNACLHRGTQLRECDGHATSLPCSFHGFCWNLDGSLKYVPSAWDFPHVEAEKFHLPELRVGTWEGFVFVNLDDNAPPLEDYLGDIVQHFESMARPPLRDRFKAVHVAKPVRCNWKVALEAFLESYHTVTTHAQSLPYAGDANTEYDIYPDQPHWDRMIMPFGVP